LREYNRAFKHNSKTIAKIETNYFGCGGDQSAKLFINNKKVYDKSDEQDWSLHPMGWMNLIWLDWVNIEKIKTLNNGIFK
jgi:hypothetical protein